MRRAVASTHTNVTTGIHVFPLLALVLFALCLAPSNAAAVVTPAGPVLQAATSKPGLLDVTFADARHGWAVGYNGKILATSDGAKTWKAQSSGTTVPLGRVAFADARHGWAAGADYFFTGDATTGRSVLLVTSDGGATWQEQHPGLDGMIPSAVSCADGDTAWVSAWSGGTAESWLASFIFTTADGGETWSRISLGAGREAISALTLLDAKRAWACVSYGDIIATQDGGVTWATAYSEADTGLGTIMFGDTSRGWAAGSVRTKRPGGSGKVDKGLILATTDGGATWRPQTVAGDWGRWWVNDVSFADARHGWAVGGFSKGVTRTGAIILSTTDGGATWRPQTPTHVTGSLRGVAAIDAKHGWAVGIDGVFSTTADYGPPMLAPMITGFTPTSGPIGTVVSITGSGFSHLSRLWFNGTFAGGFKLVSDTQVKATVPEGATSGTIKAKGPMGTTWSTSSFTVL